ncbi:hypothetical protein [Flammeovirga sp. SJP92]|uniref:hypothetical protein n=1 Tax=Flammeovirga sp. SJP92 TaxID=1775430 RepID=UPI0012F7FA2C|nr:hypothetical protein [Flammeovirga sp. SJP92]
MIYWYSDQYYKLKLPNRWKDDFHVPKRYTYRLGKKYFNHNNDWEYYDLWMEHLQLLRRQQSQPSTKYYWLRELIKDQPQFKLWKNPTVLKWKTYV